jgi:hypothetical protein
MQIDSTDAYTFEDTFNQDNCSILLKFLDVSQIFLHFSLLNKNFNSILERLKGFKKIWMVKFVQEFTSKHDQEKKKYVTTEDQEKFLKKFSDM